MQCLRQPAYLSVWLGPVEPARVSMMRGANFMAISTTVLSRLPSSLAKGFASSMSFVRFSSAGAEPNFLAYSSAEYLHSLCGQNEEGPLREDPPVLWQRESLEDTGAEHEKGEACCMVTPHSGSLQIFKENGKLLKKLK